MRDQPMLVTALILFLALIVVVRPDKPVDRDHNGVPDVEQKVVMADGYIYTHIGIMNFDPSDARAVGIGPSMDVWSSRTAIEQVDGQWVRVKVQPGSRLNIAGGDDSQWADLTQVPRADIKVNGTPVTFDADGNAEIIVP